MTTIGYTSERIAMKAIDLKPPDKLQYIFFNWSWWREEGSDGVGLYWIKKKYIAINMRPMAVSEGIREGPQNEAGLFIDIDNK